MSPTKIINILEMSCVE